MRVDPRASSYDEYQYQIPNDARQELTEWTELVGGFSGAEERAQLASLGVAAAKGILANHQANQLNLTQLNAQLKVSQHITVP